MGWGWLDRRGARWGVLYGTLLGCVLPPSFSNHLSLIFHAHAFKIACVFCKKKVYIGKFILKKNHINPFFIILG